MNWNEIKVKMKTVTEKIMQSNKIVQIIKMQCTNEVTLTKTILYIFRRISSILKQNVMMHCIHIFCDADKPLSMYNLHFGTCWITKWHFVMHECPFLNEKQNQHCIHRMHFVTCETKKIYPQKELVNFVH